MVEATRHPLLKQLISITAAVGLGWPVLAPAGTQEVQLKHLRERIDRLQRELNVAVGKRDSVRDDLQTQERRINALTESLRQIDDQLGRQATTLNGLKSREQRERAARRDQIRALETQIRAAYSMGRQPYLKVVLNQENPAAAARALVYYHYFNEARAVHIDAAEAALERLHGLEAQIAEQTRKLTDLRASRERDRQALETSRRQRADLLAALNRQVANQSDEIDRLRADEQRLERLVRELKTVLPEANVPFPAGKEHFAALKGRLPLPVAGRIIARYGQPKGVGKLTWRGIFVAAKEGEPIRAISRGRVAYADWLRGFGLLLILDHGDGYMTLYGHNEALRRHTGDWVEAGEVIATTGNTGDAPATGVYFEIRQNGVPNDPLQWCATGRINRGRARR